MTRNMRSACGSAQNVGLLERWVSAIGGGYLVLRGLSRSSGAGLAQAGLGTALLYRGTTGRCPLYAELGLATNRSRHPATAVPAGRGLVVEKSIHINRAATDLYHFWRDLTNLPRFLHHIHEVIPLTPDGNRSHWIAEGPVGSHLEWDAEIITDRPNSTIAWRSLPGGDVDSAGSVHFLPPPVQAGTRVVLRMKYDPPAGRLGARAARWLMYDPETQIEESLRHFKQLMEAGETPTTQGQPTGRKAVKA